MPGAGALTHPPASGSKKTQKRTAERARASKRKAARGREHARATDRKIGDARPRDRWPAIGLPDASVGSESNPGEAMALRERAAALPKGIPWRRGGVHRMASIDRLQVRCPSLYGNLTPSSATVA
eukprot:8729734-Alexandrium_andersonii.AAC.1